jgi:beta-mannanase
LDKSREKLIEVFAKDDAKWDKCFADVNTLGYVTNFKLSAYNPPEDPEGKKIYDQHWHKAKRGEINNGASSEEVPD